MKNKFKSKFRAVITTALSLFIFTLTSLTVSAWTGLNGGSTTNGGFTLAGTPFGILTKNDHFAWRADLYVSKNEDGKIKESDIIGNHLALVGSVLCTTSGFTACTIQPCECCLRDRSSLSELLLLTLKVVLLLQNSFRKKFPVHEALQSCVLPLRKRNNKGYFLPKW